MADGIDLTDFFARLRNSLLDLSRRLHCNASEDTLDFVRFRLQQILQHLVQFGGSLDGVPQSITDVRLFCVRVILSLVEGSAFCSLKARQTNALVHVFLRWKYGKNAAGCLLPLPLLFPLPGRLRPRQRPITKNSPVLLPGWTSFILRPFKVPCTSFSSRESRPW